MHNCRVNFCKSRVCMKCFHEDSKLYQSELQEISCIKTVKRKNIKFPDVNLKARLIYQLINTDFYLVYVIPDFTWEPKPFGWLWFKAKRNYGRVIKSVVKSDFIDILDDPNIPSEVLFHMGLLKQLKSGP